MSLDRADNAGAWLRLRRASMWAASPQHKCRAARREYKSNAVRPPFPSVQCRARAPAPVSPSATSNQRRSAIECPTRSCAFAISLNISAARLLLTSLLKLCHACLAPNLILSSYPPPNRNQGPPTGLPPLLRTPVNRAPTNHHLQG